MTDYAKISELTAANSVASTDLIEISQDLGGGLYISKKIENSNFVQDLVSNNTAATTYLKLDSSNDPLTGNLEVSKVDPEIRLTDTGDSEYSRWTRSDTDSYARQYNRVKIPNNIAPIAHWKMNDNEASTTVIESVSAYNGVAQQNTNTLSVAGVSANTGGDNGALDFGSTKYINVGDVAALEVTGAMTISAWIYPTSLSNTGKYSGILNKGYYEENLGYEITVIRTNVLGRLGKLSLTSKQSELLSSQVLTINQWYHIVGIFNGANSKLYINNVLSNSGTLTALSASNQPFYIGMRNPSAFNYASFDGRIDDVRVYNAALTTDEFNVIYNGGSGTEDDYYDNIDETVIWESKDGIVAYERGIQTFGDISGRTVIEGLTTRFNIAGTEQLNLGDGFLAPTTTNDIDLGTTALQFKNIYLTDSGKLYLGVAQDASIFYDGTNLNITNDVGGKIIIENNVSDTDIDFKVNDGGVDTTVMTIDGSTSNVGIGITTASYKLDVRNATNNSQLHFANSSSDNGGYIISVAANNFFTSSGSAYVTSQWIAKATETAIIGTQTSALKSEFEVFLDTGKTIGASFVPTMRFVVNSDGKVGIGVTSPSYTIHAYNSSGSFATAAIERKVNSSDYATTVYIPQGAASASNVLWGTGLFANSNNYVTYYFNGTASIRAVDITNSGNVGIGTTAPLRRLDVNEASGNCLRLIYNDADGSATYYVDFLVSSSGNLTITPSGGNVTIGGMTIVGVEPVDPSLSSNGSIWLNAAGVICMKTNGRVLEFE